MSSSINYPFTTEANYTPDDPSLLDFSGGKVRLKDLRPTDATFYVNFATNTNGTWGLGSLTAVEIGSPVITSGQLDITAGTIDAVQYAASGNADFTQTGTIAFEYTPDYSGSPVANRWLIDLLDDTSNTKNLIRSAHLSSGQLSFRIHDSSDATIFSVNLGVWNPTAGTKYKFLIEIDITAGASEIKIDGSKFGGTQTATGTRTNTCNKLFIGTDAGAGSSSDGKFDNLIVFSSIQTVNMSTIPQERYSTSNPSFDCNSTFNSSELRTFDDTVGLVKPANTDATYIWTVGGQDKYYNSGVVNSDGTYSQSNTGSVVSTNILDYVSTRALLSLTVFLHTSDNNVTPEIDIISITYDTVLPDPALPRIVQIEGFLYNSMGPRANLKILVRPYLSGRVNEGTFVMYEWAVVDTTNVDGHFTGNICRQPDGTFIEFKIGTQRYKTKLPDEVSVDFKDLKLEVLN